MFRIPGERREAYSGLLFVWDRPSVCACVCVCVQGFGVSLRVLEVWVLGFAVQGRLNWSLGCYGSGRRTWLDLELTLRLGQ